MYLHLTQAWEVARGDLVLPLDLLVDLSQVVHQLFLLALFPEDVGHLLLEGADDVGMDLREEAVGIRDLLGTLPSGSLRPLVPQVQCLGRGKQKGQSSYMFTPPLQKPNGLCNAGSVEGVTAHCHREGGEERATDTGQMMGTLSCFCCSR